jgi:large-conductance mechanosensitive channel
MVDIKKTLTNNIKEYINFFEKYNIIGFAIGLMIAGSVVEISNATIDSIILPSIDPIIKRKKSYIFKFGSFKIDLEKFIRSSLKFIILTIIIFILFKIGLKINIATSLVPVPTS